MHSTLTKRFLLTLLILVLPLQSIASAAMLGCALTHTQVPAHGDAAPGTPAPSAAHAQPGAHAAANHDVDRAAGSPHCHEATEAVTSAELGASGCAHCAACSVASPGLLSAPEASAMLAPVRRVVVHGDAAFAGFIPDSLERPPRFNLA